jgi:hydrogenase nickel incorporation protein HypA/HybF
MHELSIVEALISQVDKEVARSGHGGAVKQLDVAVGRLSGVNCECLRFAFELLAADTPLAAAELRITEPRAVSCCRACDARMEIEQLAVECPACGSREITIDGGRELLLESIELAD